MHVAKREGPAMAKLEHRLAQARDILVLLVAYVRIAVLVGLHVAYDAWRRLLGKRQT